MATLETLPAVTTFNSTDIFHLRNPSTNVDSKITGANLRKNIAPIGIIFDYSGTTDPSTIWKICNYLRISQITYADLFSLISHRYAKTKADRDAAETATEFHIPDFRDLYLRGGLNETFLNTAINTGTERITITGHSYSRDGTPVRFFTGGTLPSVISGLTNTSWQTIYIRVIDANTIELYDTEYNAVNIAATTGRLNFTDQGTGTHELTQQGIDILDAFQDHEHTQEINATLSQGASGPNERLHVPTTNPTTGVIAGSIGGTPRTSNETRPITNFARKIIKVLP